MNQLNLVVTCTDRKRFPPIASLRARSLESTGAVERCREWIGRLKAADSKIMSAGDLYMGNHWHVVRTIIADAKSRMIDLHVWVLSAGYGLIPLDAPLMSYAASFSLGPDQVTTTGSASLWWETLAREWEGPISGSPRTLLQLARQASAVPMLVVASDSYVRATLTDLAETLRVLTENKLAVISTGFGGHHSIRSAVLPGDNRFLLDRGGTAHTLNIKLASWALEHFHEWRHDLSSLHALFGGRLDTLQAVEQKARRRNTDTAVRSFIEKRIHGNPKGYTVLLREFRDQGLACEQKRFKQIYASVTDLGQT